VKLTLAAVASALLITGCANPGLRPLDFRPTWACTSHTTRNNIDVTVTRTLDAQGQQIDIEYQWSIGGFDRGRLALMAMQQIKDAGDPSLRARELLVSWSGFPSHLQRERLLIVLHPSDEPPNTLDGVAMIPYANDLIGGVLSWQRVASLAHDSPSAQLSLLEPRGRTIRSATVDLTRMSAAVEQTRAALDATRTKAAKFEKGCEPVTEWMKL
jgi:outer membrane murein-binding lipoprotein Lpp